jgi:hypothetical protein
MCRELEKLVNGWKRGKIKKILKAIYFFYLKKIYFNSKPYYKKAQELSQEYKNNLENFFKAMTPEEIKDHKNKLKEQRIEKKKERKFRIKKVWQIEELFFESVLFFIKEKKKLDMPVRPPGVFFLYLKTLKRGERGEASVYVSKVLMIHTIAENFLLAF